MDKQIILLNGPSSSGKSTLAEALRALIRDRLAENYEVVSIDDFMKLSPMETIYEDDVFEISGDMCLKAMEVFQSGSGVIIDHVITSRRIYDQLFEMLRPCPIRTVHVACSLDILKRREEERGNRSRGSAEDSYTYLYPKEGYEVTVDSGTMSTEENAGRIFEALFQAGRTDGLKEKTMQETERLSFRRFHDEDAPELYRYASDPEVGPIAGWQPHQSVEESLSVIRNFLSGPEVYAICLKPGGELIGSIELKLNGHTDMTERDDECELGYWLGRPFWGRGLMPEAMGEMIRHGFEDLGMTKIWCGYYEGNLRSKRCQEKCGFRYQWTSYGLEGPQMNEIRTGYVNLLTRQAWTLKRSLQRYDNHDPRIPYFHLLLEQDAATIPDEIPLPPGYHYEDFSPGDKTEWIDIEKSAREFETQEQGEAAWDRYYGGKEDTLPGRMFFVADAQGRKVATASAYYDIHTGDDGRNGWLHWVAVRRDMQGQGLSKPLITHVLSRLRELGYTRIVVSTQTTTWLAVNIYLDMGFLPVPENAKNNTTGWRIVRRLTAHPSLEAFGAASDGEMIRS